MFLSYLLQRITNAIFIVFGITTLVFLLIHIVPGDPVEVMLGETASISDRETLRESMGLDLPLFQQWTHYISGLIRFDLGNSLHSRQAVSEMLLDRIPATLILSISSLLTAMLIAFPLGILAALYKDTWCDHSAMFVAMLGVSIPNFVMGPLLMLVLALWLGWLPVNGSQGWPSLILPSITLGTALAAILSRMIRASMLEVLQEDYIRAARARGLKPMRIYCLHAMSNAALPVITILGMQFGALLAGAVITETIFSWPGIGQLLIESIVIRDYPIVQACILLISVTYILVNLLTDMLYTIIDPRLKLK